MYVEVTEWMCFCWQVLKPQTTQKQLSELHSTRGKQINSTFWSKAKKVRCTFDKNNRCTGQCSGNMIIYLSAGDDSFWPSVKGVLTNTGVKKCRWEKHKPIFWWSLWLWTFASNTVSDALLHVHYTLSLHIPEAHRPPQLRPSFLNLWIMLRTFFTFWFLLYRLQLLTCLRWRTTMLKSCAAHAA